MIFSSGACPTVYGPVSSRRQGRSLGVNLGLPERKVCTWGCVYCQCGMGERGEIAPERRPSAKEVIQSVGEALRESALSKDLRIDSITFAGNSEPAAHPDFLVIVHSLVRLRKEMDASWVINCLSNGSEMGRPDVMSAYELLDEVWIKLDCAENDLFTRLNRPVQKVGTIAQHLQRMSSLKGLLRIQTLFWDSPQESGKENGLSNSGESHREALLEAYRKLSPRKIHLTTIARQPAVSSLRPVSEVFLRRFGNRVAAEGFEVECFV